MKTTLTILCLFTLVALGQSVRPIDRAMFLQGIIKNEMRNWLVIEVTSNADDWQRDGYTPSTTIITSDFKPLYRKTPSGKYELRFVPDK